MGSARDEVEARFEEEAATATAKQPFCKVYTREEIAEYVRLHNPQPPPIRRSGIAPSWRTTKRAADAKKERA